MGAPLRFAHFSPDGRYRYWLSREWAPADVPRVTFVMLNPSTADHRRDDQTVGRCVGFARAWGYGGVVVGNLYAWCATRPRHLWRSPDPVGPDNDRWLAGAAQTAAITLGPIVAAWGANARPERVAAVLELPGMDRLTALGFTRAGHPRHPLYLPADSPLIPFPRAERPDSHVRANALTREHVKHPAVPVADRARGHCRASTNGPTEPTATTTTTRGDYR